MLLLLLAIAGSSRSLPFLQKQSRYPGVRKSGCLFCACCWLGGLQNIDEVDQAFEWATKLNKVHQWDSYVNMDKYTLAKQIAAKFGRTYKTGYKIIHGRNHFYVVNSNTNEEVYNSAGWGWGL